MILKSIVFWDHKKISIFLKISFHFLKQNIVTSKMFLKSIVILIIIEFVRGAEFFTASAATNYDDAILKCKEQNGVLATMANQEDYNTLASLCQPTGRHCWVGLHRRVNNNWEYLDGTSVKNTYGFDNNGNPTHGSGPWDSGQPGAELCGGIANHGKLHDFVSFEANFIPLCMRVKTKPIYKLCVHYHTCTDILYQYYLIFYLYVICSPVHDCIYIKIFFGIIINRI